MISRTAVLENYVWTELSSRNTDDAGNGGSDEAAHYWVLEKGAHVEVDSIRAPVDALEIRSRSTAEDFPAQLKHRNVNRFYVLAYVPGQRCSLRKGRTAVGSACTMECRDHARAEC